MSTASGQPQQQSASPWGCMIVLLLAVLIFQNLPSCRLQLPSIPLIPRPKTDNDWIRPRPQPKPAPITVADQLIKSHNDLRDGHLLIKDKQLMEAAQTWAETMAKRRLMVHQPLHNLGDWDTAGENIASGLNTVDSVMLAWMSSLGHRRNILSKSYTHIGVGIAEVSGRRFWCVCFGGRGGQTADWDTQPAGLEAPDSGEGAGAASEEVE